MPVLRKAAMRLSREGSFMTQPSAGHAGSGMR